MKQLIRPAVVMLLVFSISARSEDAEAKKKDIRKMLNDAGVGEAAMQSAKATVASLKKDMPDTPDEFWVGIMKEYSPEGFVEMLIPVYDKQFSHDEIKKILVAMTLGDAEPTPEQAAL